MRVVKIDERERPAISIEVAGATFLIKRVVTGVRQRWGEFLQLQGEALQQVNELKKRLDATANKDKAATEKLQNDVTTMNSYTEQIAKSRESAERDCIKLILEKNGYEFDWRWWVDETDSTDRQQFILEALNKDAVEGQSKKKEVK